VRAEAALCSHGVLLIVALVAVTLLVPGLTGPASAASAASTAAWCGTVSQQDRPQTIGGYPVRVVYAYPSDGVDRSATFAPQIAAAADEIDGWWRREDPSRSPRFDLYVDSCGPQYDLTVLRVSAAQAANTDASNLFSLVANDARGFQGSSRTKYLVFYDGATGIGQFQTCGVGATSVGLGFGLGVVFLGSCTGVSVAAVAAHELLHALGSSDPLTASLHTCPGDAGHVCDSTLDILFPNAASGVPLSSYTLDVNHDDYYGPSVKSGVQTSPWLRLVNDQVRLRVGITGPGSVYSDVAGVDCAASCGVDWDRGARVFLSTLPKGGYRFVRWGGACTGAGTCQVELAAAATVTAMFAPDSFALRLGLTGRGVVSSFPAAVKCAKASCAAKVASFEPVVLAGKPARGWKFARWAGACKGSNPRCTVPMTAPTGVTALFAQVAKKR
jgi:hypothetical protein